MYLCKRRDYKLNLIFPLIIHPHLITFKLMKGSSQFISLVITFILTNVQALAFDFQVDGLCYNFFSKKAQTVEITYYDSYNNQEYVEGDVIIPETILYAGKTYSVVKIGESAFNNCEELKSITIPNTVAFIGRNAFYGCFKLETVNLGNSVSEIHDSALAGCPLLSFINVSEENQNFASYQGVLFAKDMRTLKFCGQGRKGSIYIPNSVTSIGDWAFSDCMNISYIDIPNSVTHIGISSFNNCKSLTSVSIPSSVSFINSCAFNGCSGLTSISIPSSVQSIGHEVFDGCDNLTDINVSPENTNYCSIDGMLFSKNGETLMECCDGKEGRVTIPSSTTYIWSGAFRNCAKINSISIPNSVTQIGECAFEGCKELQSINIPTSISKIPRYTFAYCSLLASITIPNSINRIEIGAFQYCYSLSSISIPNSVTEIEYSAFYACYFLNKITIGNSVSKIDKDAFAGCYISEIYCTPPTPPVAGNVNFLDEVYSNAILYIPVGTENLYKTIFPWSNFQHITEINFSCVESPLQETVKIDIHDGILIVSGNDEALIEIFDVQGRRVLCNRGNISSILPKGVYVVRALGKTIKIKI